VSLDQAQVAQYLLERKLINPEAIVEGEFRVEDVSRLNRVFLVTAAPGGSYVVKAGESVAREADVLRRLANGMRRWLPGVAAVGDGVLVLEAAPGAQDFARCQPTGRYSRTLARECGRALAALHGLPTHTIGHAGAGNFAERLRVHHLDLASMRAMSAGSLEVVRLVQNADGLSADLDTLAADSITEAVIHGDVRWENCLGLRAGTRRTRLQLIDWEFAAPGDPAADVGAFFGEYLRAWLASLSTLSAAASQRSSAELARMQSALRAFWAAYVAGRGVVASPLGRLLRRAVRHAGARLVVAAWEEGQTRADAPPQLYDAVRLGAELLRRPDEAGVQILGLRPVWAAA
jgi:aminoglycoside phosphotransferase (APT) family kinase protein